MKTICFTGHRPDKLRFYDKRWIAATLTETIRSAALKGYYRYISGGALGIDQMALDILTSSVADTFVLGLIKVVARPFPSQSERWNTEQVREYRRLLALADEVIDVCTDPPTNWKYQKRNEWMVNQSDVVIAVWDGSKGGTANCVEYARQKGKPILRINPYDLSQSWILRDGSIRRMAQEQCTTYP